MHKGNKATNGTAMQSARNDPCDRKCLTPPTLQVARESLGRLRRESAEMNLEVNTSPTDTGIRAAHREALITAELATRASRRPNHGAEAKVLRRLAHALATSDAAMLDMLTSEAARLCKAGSAGISVLESPPDKPASFRWAALAGHCAPLLNTYRPFDDSVCGVTLAMGFRSDRAV